MAGLLASLQQLRRRLSGVGSGSLHALLDVEERAEPMAAMDLARSPAGFTSTDVSVKAMSAP